MYTLNKRTSGEGMKMRPNISGLQNRRPFEYEDERDKLENLVFKFFSIS